LLNQYEADQANPDSAEGQQELTSEHVASQLDAHHILIRYTLASHINEAARLRGLKPQPLMSSTYDSAPDSWIPGAPSPPEPQSPQPEPAPRPLAWRVRIATDPAGASIYYLPEFAYQWNRRRGVVEDLQNWYQLLGNVVDLSGNYRFYVRWDRLGQTKMTSKVSITRPQTLYLQP
jgi:hypothetical protein